MFKLMIVCHDVPYPPVHGGRVDMWNRIQGFHRLGIQMQLLYWLLKNETVKEHTRKTMASVAEDLIEIERAYRLRDFFHPKYPPRVLSFDMRGDTFERVRRKVQAFDPDYIMLDGWHGYLAARKLSKSLKKPLIYRSHNVEYKYFWSLCRAASGFSKIKLFLEASRLYANEREIRSVADVVLDICEADANEWAGVEVKGRKLVLPPVWDFSSMTNSQSIADTDIDICFVGNLRTPNNVQGLHWFCKKVLPILRLRGGGRLRVVFAGSNPARRAIELCRQWGLECHPNPKDVHEYYRRSRVLINPDFDESGVKIKLIEMLASGRPVVATTSSVRGLPLEIRKFVHTASNEFEFAQQIQRSIHQSTDSHSSRRIQALERHFGEHRLVELLGYLGDFRDSQKTTPVVRA